jgi:hypothetical protein
MTNELTMSGKLNADEKDALSQHDSHQLAHALPIIKVVTRDNTCTVRFWDRTLQKRTVGTMDLLHRRHWNPRFGYAESIALKDLLRSRLMSSAILNGPDSRRRPVPLSFRAGRT